MTESIDPRVVAIEDRLANVERVIAVTGSKGGIGKTVVASLLALTLADRGRSVGLFDLDFTSPTDHVVLGSVGGFPTETFGIDPVSVAGIDMMSIAFLSGRAATPLRGGDATNALLELLAVTNWGSQDLLLLDMPRYVPRVEFLLVATASRLVVDSVRRAAALLTELDAPILGVVENLQRRAGGVVHDLADEFGLDSLGAVPFDESLEVALGDVRALRDTDAYAAVTQIGEESVGRPPST